MATSKANATWEGTLKAGRGTMKPANGPDVAFSMGTRFEGAQGSNPEEMIGAALAGCFSMALSAALERAGMTPKSIRTTATVELQKATEGFEIKRIELSTEAQADGGDEAKLLSVAEDTKKSCPVSKALRSVPEITLRAKLVR
jgi:osmotically inducible protein OsmC